MVAPLSLMATGDTYDIVEHRKLVFILLSYLNFLCKCSLISLHLCKDYFRSKLDPIHDAFFHTRKMEVIKVSFNLW